MWREAGQDSSLPAPAGGDGWQGRVGGFNDATKASPSLPHVVECALVDALSAPDDDDVVGDLFDVAELVRREEDGGAVLAGLLDEQPEGVFDTERVEAVGGLVELL